MKTSEYLAASILLGALLTGVYYWTNDTKPSSAKSIATTNQSNERQLSLYGFSTPLRPGSGAGMRRKSAESKPTLNRIETQTAAPGTAPALDANRVKTLHKRKRLFH